MSRAALLVLLFALGFAVATIRFALLNSCNVLAQHAEEPHWVVPPHPVEATDKWDGVPHI